MIAGFALGFAVLAILIAPNIDDLAGRDAAAVTVTPTELALIAARAILATAAGPGCQAAPRPASRCGRAGRPRSAAPPSLQLRPRVRHAARRHVLLSWFMHLGRVPPKLFGGDNALRILERGAKGRVWVVLPY